METILLVLQHNQRLRREVQSFRGGYCSDSFSLISTKSVAGYASLFPGALSARLCSGNGEFMKNDEEQPVAC
ncbi:hypothetical protein NC652_022973 [Populus alba x Populus x berolinensis]|nr:hypothetical protein NC652_022973 [Populus alba x Populus x berolinensis]